MKTTMKKVAIVLLAAATIALTNVSCKKDPGPAGKDGTNGKDGNANVVSSSITSSAWSYSAPSWQISFTYPAITQDIIDKGAVLVYVKVGSAYNQLPLTTYPTSSYSETYEVSTVVGGLTVYVTDSDLTQPTNPGSETFKIVVIAASNLVKHPGVNLKNYDEVKQAFNIKD